jgi:asparagine synthase (glutamine-hydrolysing)
MCGIAGLLHDERAALASGRLLGDMCDRIIHRGPDAYGELVSGPVALGHRRLSIIDLSGGDQPIFNEDRSVAVVFNGEIYNHKALRHWLTGLGHVFRTKSDTEVLAHAYEHEGPEFVKRLRGMFAFALWDARRGRLMIARDRLGKKPLYYTHQQGKLAFASELKALLADKGLDLTLDHEAISDYLSFLCVIAPKTPFKHVRKLPPAHYLLAEGGHVTLREYWDADPNHMDVRALPEVKDELFALLDDAVACRLESEVPLGAFLSGGVDSSTVVGLMSRHTQVKTANIGFDVPDLDESKYAEQVATLFKTDHRSQKVKIDAAAEDELERLVWHLDEPFADPSAIPTHRVSGVARKSVTVALSGDGGDEVFGGYDRYRTDLLLNSVRGALPQPLREKLFGTLAGQFPRGRARTALDDLAHDAQRAHFRSVSYFRDPEKSALFAPEMRDTLRGYDSMSVLGQHYTRVEGRDPLSGILYVDMKTYLPDRMLMKVDKMAMMHSLEVRSPFLDQFVVEMGLRIPARWKVRDGQGKWILKQTMERLLPKDILYRSKQGFDVPLAGWLRGPIAEPLEAALTALGKRGYLAPAALRRLFDEHQAGIVDHSAKLWILYMLELWHRVFRISP